MATTRRGFVVGCSAAIASLAGSRFGSFAFASNPGPNDPLLVVVFLRGGIDGHNLVPPTDHPDRGLYEAARPNLQVPAGGSEGALNVGQGFGLHPAAEPIYELFQDGRLAIVQAAGMTTNATRSHFDAMQYLELGTPGSNKTGTGWLTRHLESTDSQPGAIIPVMASGNLNPTSLRGSQQALNVGDINDFHLNDGAHKWRQANRVALRRLFETGETQLHQTSRQALDSADIIELSVGDGYDPANGAEYPSGSFGRNLRSIAQIIKLELGLQVATLDLGGWDTHNGQGRGSGGYFANQVSQLTRGLAGFYTDLDGSGAANYTRRLVVVVQSEFGRRLRENDDQGTDHGHANPMLVMGGEVNGGVHGNWPGLHNEQLFDGADLDVSTDFRRVLSEIVVRRFGNTNIEDIFPGYSQQYATEGPLGVVQGTDLPVGGGGGHEPRQMPTTLGSLG